MNVLVLGGTVFVGRHIVDAALARGHRVTIFHRGQHGEDAHPDVEHIHGNRTVDLHLLTGRRWDAVLDTCGFDGPTVAASAALLAHSIAHYGFVSSVSAYRDWPASRVDETSVLKELGGAEDDYGAGKVAAEHAVEAVFSGRVLISRPGLIVGPHENIGRLPHWLRRLARGGDVLAPGSPDEWRQWVDARDLAEFHLRAAENEQTGVFNAVGPPAQFTMGQLLGECRAVTGSRAETHLGGRGNHHQIRHLPLVRTSHLVMVNGG